MSLLSLLGDIAAVALSTVGAPSALRVLGAFTCSRTLAVSRGKVQRSATQAAVPALKNFTAAVGGTSGGFRPTMTAGRECKGLAMGRRVLRGSWLTDGDGGSLPRL